jgi:hypothetical protein
MKNKMKTRNAVLMLAAAVVSSTMALAGDPSPKMAILNSNNSEVYKVIYEGAKGENVTLKVSNIFGKVILSESIKGKNRFSCPLNFAGLDAGVYTVAVTDENGTVTQQVAYGVKSEKSQSETLRFVHVGKLQDGKYLMAVNSKTAGNITVSILDGDENVIYNESLAVNGTLAKIYNIKKVEGTPVFRITDNEGFKVVR